MSARGLLVVAASLLVCTFAGCGVASADLFLVERSGPGSQPPLSVLVSEEGVVRCDRGAPVRLSDPMLIEARTLQEELHGPATRHLSLPSRPGSVFGYRVRDGEGSVSFADNSSGEPKVLERLQLFTLKVARSVCHLPV